MRDGGGNFEFDIVRLIGRYNREFSLREVQLRVAFLHPSIFHPSISESRHKVCVETVGNDRLSLESSAEQRYEKPCERRHTLQREGAQAAIRGAPRGEAMGYGCLKVCVQTKNVL